MITLTTHVLVFNAKHSLLISYNGFPHIITYLWIKSHSFYDNDTEHSLQSDCWPNPKEIEDVRCPFNELNVEVPNRT